MIEGHLVLLSVSAGLECDYADLLVHFGIASDSLESLLI